MEMEGRLLKQKGFTITEVTILIVIVAIFLSALLPLIVKNMVANDKSKTRRIAYEAVHEKIEEIRNLPFDSLADGNFQVPTVSGGSGQVTVDNDLNSNGQIELSENDVAKVTVSVVYPEKNQSKTISISTIVVRGGISN